MRCTRNARSSKAACSPPCSIWTGQRPRANIRVSSIVPLIMPAIWWAFSAASAFLLGCFLALQAFVAFPSEGDCETIGGGSGRTICKRERHGWGALDRLERGPPP